MAVTEEMIILDEWQRDSKNCRLRKNGLCSYLTTKTECNPQNCLRLDSKARKALSQVQA